jgi:uncharacterized LabA/DUF88 family protein
VAVFIDSQNLRRDSRRAFHDNTGPNNLGQIYPRKLAELLASRGPKNATTSRVLDAVRVYCGEPNPSKDKRAHSAHLRQRAAWLAAGVEVRHRPLQYPDDWPNSPEQEKGVDVFLAVDLLYHALRKNFEVGIVVSTDTDLIPALLAVCDLTRAWGKPKIEVASWGVLRKQLLAEPYHIHWHAMQEPDYLAVQDTTDYAALAKAAAAAKIAKHPLPPSRG